MAFHHDEGDATCPWRINNCGHNPLLYSFHSAGELIVDPDKQVQQSLRLLFETFRRTGSAMGTVKAFRRQGLLFPRRLRTGARKGELVWTELGRTHTLRLEEADRLRQTQVERAQYEAEVAQRRSRCGVSGLRQGSEANLNVSSHTLLSRCGRRAGTGPFRSIRQSSWSSGTNGPGSVNRMSLGGVLSRNNL
jgi:hypothetical protein